MSTLNFASPIFPTTTPIAANAFRDLIDSAVPANSLAIINGHLDQDNAAAAVDFTVQAEHTQRGSHVRLHSASGTADLDYFLDVFGQETTTIGTNESHFLPGAGRSWYQPWTGDALVLWTVNWGNNSIDPAHLSAVWLNVDGTFHGPTRRNIARSVNTGSPYAQYGVVQNRSYSGHFLLTGVAEGRHSADIKIASNGPKHTRHYARHIIVVPLKRYS